MDQNLWWEHLASWPLRDRLELLVFDFEVRLSSQRACAWGLLISRARHSPPDLTRLDELEVLYRELAGASFNLEPDESGLGLGMQGRGIVRQYHMPSP